MTTINEDYKRRVQENAATRVPVRSAWLSKRADILMKAIRDHMALGEYDKCIRWASELKDVLEALKDLD